MHQDQRIGLALAVLLLGAAGAFFFRNDPKPADSSPRLKSGRELDARIAEKAISPYLQNTDEDQEPRGTSAKSVSDKSGNEHRLPHLDTPDFLEGQRSTVDRGTSDLTPIPFSDLNESDNSKSKATSANDKTTGERTHTVVKGETLSSIAAKELGSSGRFQELFDANRDQLKDANDVRVGMSLRIPARWTSRVEPSMKTRDRVNAAPPLLPEDSSRTDADVIPDPQPGTGKKLFEPAKRPPLGVKSMGTQSSDATPAKPNRKLSQMPPKDASGKVAR